MKKHPLKSKTIWGLLIAALPVFARVAGVAFTEAETQSLIEAFTTIFGLSFAAYGRAVAKGPLADLHRGTANLLCLGMFVGVLLIASGCTSDTAKSLNQLMPKGSMIGEASLQSNTLWGGTTISAKNIVTTRSHDELSALMREKLLRDAVAAIEASGAMTREEALQIVDDARLRSGGPTAIAPPDGLEAEPGGPGSR